MDPVVEWQRVEQEEKLRLKHHDNDKETEEVFKSDVRLLAEAERSVVLREVEKQMGALQIVSGSDPNVVLENAGEVTEGVHRGAPAESWDDL